MKYSFAFLLLILISINLNAQVISDENVVSKDSSGRKLSVLDRMPSFPGGDAWRVDFLVKNIRYPKLAGEKGIQGTVYVGFVVDTTGKIEDVTILRGIGGGCDEEALRVVKLMPKWKPGKVDGKKVRVQFSMPIQFTLGDGSPPSKSNKKSEKK